jgi:hypothetical protein
MAICTISDIKSETSYVDNGATDDQLRSMLGGLCEALEGLLNRNFPHVIESYSVDESANTVTFISPQHGLSIGDEVWITSLGGESPIENLQTVTAVESFHSFSIAYSGTLAQLEAISVYTIRKIRNDSMPTYGHNSIFLDPRPVANVLSVSIGNESNEATLLEATDYMLAETTGGISESGELYRIGKMWPKLQTRRQTILRRGDVPMPRRAMPAGARVKWVVGEAFPIPALANAMITLCIQYPKANEIQGFASVSYDYYSVSRISSAEIGKIFVEAEHMLKQYRLPLI